MKIGKRRVSDWIELFNKSKIRKRLVSIYGRNDELIKGRLNTFLFVLNKFKQIYGDEEVSFVRTPGRLNLLGRHVDHRGSLTNPISIQKEIILCYKARDDDKIEIHNLDSNYGFREFNIKNEITSEKTDNEEDWLDFTQRLTNERMSKGTNTDWVNKLKAVPVYLQKTLFRNMDMKGFCGVLDSNIPPRIGLSSSSSVVVAMMDALLDTNNQSVEKDKYSYYCGVAEWYVGTRGGFGDHAAIKFGRLGMITHLKSAPVLEIDSYIPFPERYSIVIFHSGIEADKTGAAGQKFNEKVATYAIGEIFIKNYIKQKYPTVYEKINKLYLADIIEYFSDKEIYGLIRSLPENIDRKGLLEQLKDEQKTLSKYFATHKETEYKIRAVILYGISECARAKITKDFLDKGDINKFGDLMNISHDGDRVSNISEKLDEIKRNVKKDTPVYLHPGDYNCSIREIDELVDIALKNHAVGAQISGAGLGGSVMALVAKKNLSTLIKNIRKDYYKPKKITENHTELTPIEGSGIL